MFVHFAPSVTVNYTQHVSALRLGVQQYLISFETAAHFRKGELYFFKNWLKWWVHLFYLRESLRLVNIMMFCVK